MTHRFRIPSIFWIIVLLTAAVAVVFWQARNFGFIQFDDPSYVTENAHVQAGLTRTTFLWALTTTHAANWHPLTWLSHMLDCQLFGLNPGAHHLTSVLLHLANTILLLLVLHRMTGLLWRSAFVAALFALHPLHVESVSWVAERKDVLSTLFWLAALWAHARYAERSNVRRYLTLVFIVSLGLMAKPMLVTVPFVLLLLDYWPLKRLTRGRPGVGERIQWRIVLEKGVLLCLAAISSVITYAAQHAGGAVRTAEEIPLRERASNVFVAYLTYLWKTLWPSGLTVFYPHPKGSLPLWEIAGAILLLTFISILAYRARRLYPYILVGWLWYLGTLVPVIGLVQIGSQAMADRYTYVPLIGIFILVAWFVPDLVFRPAETGGRRRGERTPSFHRQLALGGLSACVILACITCSRTQAGYWRDNQTLFEHALQVTRNNFLAHFMLGGEYARQGRLEDATHQFELAARLKPDHVDTHFNLGLMYYLQRRSEDAIREYEAAIKLNPLAYAPHNNLGALYLQQNRNEEALLELRAAAELDASSPMPHLGMGKMYMNMKRLNEAVRELEIACKLSPSEVEPHQLLGLAYDKQDKLDEAVKEFRSVLALAPDDFDAHNNLGYVYGRLGKTSEAIQQLEKAVKLNPDHPEPHNNLGEVYRKLKKYDEAVKELRIALRLAPNHVEAHANLGKVYLDQGDRGAAIREFELATKLDPSFAEATENLKAVASARKQPR